MQPSTVLEQFRDPGAVVRLEIVQLRSSIAPQWWEARRRFRWWRLCQRVRSDRKKLSSETQTALAWAEEALEREFLYGRDEW